MPFSLYVFLYKRYQENYQRNFEKTNKLLDTKIIKDLISSSDKDKSVEIFHSAIEDHAPVDGFPYYLTPPIAPLFYHDYFKRALIAEALGRWSGSLSLESSQNAVAVLKALTHRELPGYVQIFAWHALGRWAASDQDLFSELKNDFLAALSGSAGSVIAGLCFLDEAVLSKTDIVELLAMAAPKVRYQVQKAVFGYYLIRHSVEIDIFSLSCKNDRNLRDFFGHCQRGKAFGLNYFEIGIREVGLIPLSQKGGLMEGTQQADIAERLRKISYDYTNAAGFFLKTYWS